MVDAWTLRGELALSCSCTVFCPCVLSLGQSAPTEGYCLTWAAVRIDEGQFGAPIIQTPFNYRYGQQYGAEFTVNYATGPLSIYFNGRGRAKGLVDLGLVLRESAGRDRQKSHNHRYNAFHCLFDLHVDLP